MKLIDIDLDSLQPFALLSKEPTTISFDAKQSNESLSRLPIYFTSSNLQQLFSQKFKKIPRRGWQEIYGGKDESMKTKKHLEITAAFQAQNKK